jgi:hypothetical protein
MFARDKRIGPYSYVYRRGQRVRTDKLDCGAGQRIIMKEGPHLAYSRHPSADV